MKYLKIKNIQEIYSYDNLRAKYNVTEPQMLVEGLLSLHIQEGLLKLPERPNNVSKKNFEKELNQIKLEYLKSQSNVTDDMIKYFIVNYIENKNLNYNPLSHRYKHIIIFDNGQDWVRSIDRARFNAITTDGVKGILARHNDEHIFIIKTSVFKCIPTGNKAGNYKEVELSITDNGDISYKGVYFK